MNEEFKFNPEVSVEKFAAFLDGNLSIEEMNDVSFLVENDINMSNIMEINDIIDNLYIDNVIGEGIELPFELQTSEFELPDIITHDNNVDSGIDMFTNMQIDHFTSFNSIFEQSDNIDDNTIETLSPDMTDSMDWSNNDDYISDADDSSISDIDSIELNNIEY